MNTRKLLSICAASLTLVFLCASISYADCDKCKTKKQEVCAKDCAKKDSATCIPQCITQKCTKPCNKEAKAQDAKVVVNQTKQPKKAGKPVEQAQNQKQVHARNTKGK